MSRFRSANRRQIVFVGVVLCLLAALFAIESKIAWYQPDTNPTGQISSAKMLAADTSRALVQAAASSPSQHFFGIAALLTFVLIFRVVFLRFFHALPARQLSSRFSRRLFCRPPPAC